MNYKIKERFETGFSAKETEMSDIPLIMITEPELSEAFSIPLYFFQKQYKNFSLIPISHSSFDLKKHFDFGTKLREEITQTNKRIGVVASANLCENKEFNEKIIELIKHKKIKQLLELDEKIIKKKKIESFLKTILILLGILKELNYQPEILSFQSPFEKAHAVINFKLK